MLIDAYGALTKSGLAGQMEVLGEDPIPVPVHPPQIPYGLPWD